MELPSFSLFSFVREVCLVVLKNFLYDTINTKILDFNFRFYLYILPVTTLEKIMSKKERVKSLENSNVKKRFDEKNKKWRRLCSKNGCESHS
jgi:hypothetical protein